MSDHLDEPDADPDERWTLALEVADDLHAGLAVDLQNLRTRAANNVTAGGVLASVFGAATLLQAKSPSVIAIIPSAVGLASFLGVLALTSAIGKTRKWEKGTNVNTLMKSMKAKTINRVRHDRAIQRYADYKVDQAQADCLSSLYNKSLGLLAIEAGAWLSALYLH